MSETYEGTPLKRILPHRFPMLLLDSVSYDKEENPDTISAQRIIPRWDVFMFGHFRGNPVFPGVLQMEMINQAAACMIKLRFPEITSDPAVVSSGNAKFKDYVKPGDVLKIEVKMKKNRSNRFFVFDGIIKRSCTVVCELTDMMGTYQ
jgi:3-hydroxyacyl-[acyl-carrier-protein] dehydratase